MDTLKGNKTEGDRIDALRGSRRRTETAAGIIEIIQRPPKSVLGGDQFIYDVFSIRDSEVLNLGYSMVYMKELQNLRCPNLEAAFLRRDLKNYDMIAMIVSFYPFVNVRDTAKNVVFEELKHKGIGSGLIGTIEHISSVLKAKAMHCFTVEDWMMGLLRKFDFTAMQDMGEDSNFNYMKMLSGLR